MTYYELHFKRVILVLSTVICLIVCTLASCVKIKGRNGTWLYKKPISIGRHYATDTNMVTIISYDPDIYSQKITTHNNKRIFMHFHVADLVALAATGNIDYVVFYKPGCSGDFQHIRDLDSLVRKGRHIMAVALALDTKRNQKMVSHTSFEQYPVLFIDGKTLPKYAALRQIAFIREACSACYDYHKDDLTDTYCLSLKTGKIEVMMFKDAPDL